MLCFAAVLSQAGCGPDYKARAVVRGKVSFGSGAVNAGTVSFVSSDNRTGSAEIVKGKYEMNDAPIGDVKIIITIPPNYIGGIKLNKRPENIQGMPSDMGGDESNKGAPGKATPVPDKYTKVETTPLTYTVIKGEQEYDIKMTP